MQRRLSFHGTDRFFATPGPEAIAPRRLEVHERIKREKHPGRAEDCSFGHCKHLIERHLVSLDDGLPPIR